jgi:hypothetical protein
MWTGYRKMKRRCLEKENACIERELKDSL